MKSMGHIHELIDWVVTICIVRKDKVLLVKHKKQQLWLPIGGHVELDEDPEQALKREVKEECGLEIELIGSSKGGFVTPVSKPLPAPVFLDIHEVTPTHKHIGLMYFARAKSGDVKLAADEHEDIRWFTRADLHNPEFDIKPAILFYCEQALKMDEYVKKSRIV